MKNNTPHQTLAELDAAGVAYTIVHHNITHGTTGMAFIEKAVLSHTEDWVQLQTVAMQSRKTTGTPPPILNGQFLKDRNEDHPTWYRWKKLPPFEIKEQ